MEKKIIETELAPSAVGTYSQGVLLNGVYYFSGQIGLKPETMEMAEGVEGQLAQIMKNIDGLIKSQNLERTNIFKTTIFLAEMSDFPLVNQAYEAFFEQPYPARSCVAVKELPKGALVEIEVLAHQ